MGVTVPFPHESPILECEQANEQEVLGKQFKIYGTFENPLFLAKDVAEWIEHTNVSSMLQKVDEDEKVKLNNTYFENRTGGNGTMFLTEDGLYEVLMQSRKPNAQGQKLVSGRELYEVLGIKVHFSTWMKRMCEYGFQENIDFSILKSGNPNGGIAKIDDYAITLEMAKHIAMVQRTEIGMQVRNYFLECEKYGFQENVDYTLLAKNSVNPKGGRPQSDYLLLKYPCL